MGKVHPTKCKLQIGIFGTFDVENYGDLLFPLIAEAELSKRLGPINLHRFSYHEKTQDNWPYPVISLTELPKVAKNLDGVVIGGGHIIRFDKWIAPNYFPPIPSIHHPTGYWLTPILIALEAGLPVTWNAPGVHGDIPEWANPLLELAISGSRYVSVRDEPSRQALMRFAGNTEIHVVSDSAFGIARLLNTQGPSSDFIRLCHSLDLRNPYLIVQASKDLGGFARFVQDHPQMYRDYRILILQPGPIMGERDATLDYDIPGAVRLPTWPPPLLLAELIRNAAAVVGVSLHLSITALVFGVPLFRRANTFSGKHAVLSKFCGVFTFNDEDGIDPELFAAKQDRETSSPEVNAAVHQLSKHWDKIADIFIDNTKMPTATSRANSRFWQALPRLLEASARPISAHSTFKERIVTTLLKFLARRRRRGVVTRLLRSLDWLLRQWMGGKTWSI